MPNKENKSPLESSGMDIPDYAIERMARCLLPMMQKYYESRYCQDFCANSLILMRTCKDHDNHLLS